MGASHREGCHTSLASPGSCLSPGRERRNAGTQAPAPGRVGTTGPRGSMLLHGAPASITAQDLATSGETTLLQERSSRGKRGWKGHRASQPTLPYSGVNCPFDLNSHCKSISANQRIQPPALRVPGKRPAFPECQWISRLLINHTNLDPSVLTGCGNLPPPRLP